MQQIELNRRRVMSVISGGSIETHNPLTIIAIENTTIRFTIPVQVTPTYFEYIEYSLDNGKNWSRINNTNEVVSKEWAIELGQRLLLRGKGISLAVSNDYYSHFTTTNKADLYGNIMSLLEPIDYANKTELTQDFTFSNLFHGFKTSTMPLLPATSLSQCCYYEMFRLSEIIEAKELPANTVLVNSYRSMFEDCAELIIAPKIKGTVLKSNACSTMFRNCVNLEELPECTFDEVSTYSCSNMFVNCSKLKNAPLLSALNLDENSYANMFEGCTQLSRIQMLAINISARNCLYSWVYNVSQTGTFIKNPAMTTLPTGMSGIPSGWTVEDYAG